jgi:hypothetical protein
MFPVIWSNFTEDVTHTCWFKLHIFLILIWTYLDSIVQLSFCKNSAYFCGNKVPLVFLFLWCCLGDLWSFLLDRISHLFWSCLVFLSVWVVFIITGASPQTVFIHSCSFITLTQTVTGLSLWWPRLSYGGQSGHVTGFAFSPLVSHCQYHSTNAPYSFSSACCSYKKGKPAKPRHLPKKLCCAGSWGALDRN